MSHPAAFRAAAARSVVAKDLIVTLGIRPSRADTGFGYIQCGDVLSDGLHVVTHFAEKPALAVAQAYVAEGDYLWNAGIFAFSPDVMVGELAERRPDILATVKHALAMSRSDGHALLLDDASFAAVPSISLDTAVMEGCRRAAVIPCELGWTDLGTFDAIWRQGPRNEDGNVLHGRAVALETTGTLIIAQDRTVAVFGVNDLIIVATSEAVAVLPRDRAQSAGLLASAAMSIEQSTS
jgi:mannose-1-phosphate guanylyltransferase